MAMVFTVSIDFRPHKQDRIRTALRRLSAASRPVWFPAPRWTVIRERVGTAQHIVTAVDNVSSATLYGYSVDELVHQVRRQRDTLTPTPERGTSPTQPESPP